MANKQLEVVHTAVVGKSGLRHSWCYGSTKVQLLNKMDATFIFLPPRHAGASHNNAWCNIPPFAKKNIIQTQQWKSMNRVLTVCLNCSDLVLQQFKREHFEAMFNKAGL